MSSLAPGCTLQGTHWKYHILQSVKGDSTHISSVFKVTVIQDKNARNAPNAPKRAFIKAASPSDATARENMNRDRQIYHLPSISSATCFRKMYESIDDSTIALEWLDTTLAEVKYQPNTRIYALIVTVLREVLNSCIFLEGHNYVNTDYKPGNVLLSGIESGNVTAKVGDLGLVVPVGSLFNCQPYAMRAPEVFLGQACTGPSQVWAIAAMLLCWIKPGVLGVWDSPYDLINEAWSMAKIKRLFPYWHIPTPDEVEGGHILKTAVESAICFSREVPDLQAILPFEEETQKVEMPCQLRDLLRFMLVVNPLERPSASCVLSSMEFHAFEKFAGV